MNQVFEPDPDVSEGQSGFPEGLSTREKILQASFQLFCTKGIGEATTKNIAEAAQVNEVTLFRHFGSKEGLLEEVVREQFERSKRVFMGFSPDTDVESVIDMLAEHMRQKMRSDAPFMQLIYRQATSHPQLGQLMDELRKPMIDFMRAYFKTQMDTGAMRKMNPSIAAGLLFHPLMSIAIMDDESACLMPKDIDIDELIDEHIRMYKEYILIRE